MLLEQLRDTMARGGTAPRKRLGEVVRLVADEMVAEVCSIYLLRAGEVLELFATQGLNPSARCIARACGSARASSATSPRTPSADARRRAGPSAIRLSPETGEEIYPSLAGVPIVRAEAVLGVLVVQNRTQRLYDEEEIETLQTIAMVLAEMVAAGQLRQSRWSAAGRWPRPAAAAHRWRAAHAGHRDWPRRAARAAYRHPGAWSPRMSASSSTRFERRWARARRRRPSARGR